MWVEVAIPPYVIMRSDCLMVVCHSWKVTNLKTHETRTGDGLQYMVGLRDDTRV